ncbi:Inner membrane protein YabI [Buchnera aphidicola (Pterocallis alni)]|uniref:DedA family protein n=1 Tax=Buchnera aphidicola TaxID=9 RepID=UPI0034643C34
MKSCLTYLITESTKHPLIIIALITFFESLALIGFLLPSIIIMTALGALIGNGKIPLYQAWITASIGCLISDYVSYYIGWKFKKKIYHINILKRNIKLFNKTKNTLIKYSIITILIGKFIGPTRPLIPMISGMLNIPIKYFITPSVIGCIIWPILYFSPGILTSTLLQSNYFDSKKYILKIIILPIICIISIIIFIIWKIFKNKQK